MGGASSIIPDELDQNMVEQLMGKNFEQEFFDKLQQNGTVKKDVFIDKMRIRTDVFLTHDWGEHQSNHIKVAKVNQALKLLGVRTWFDEEQMQGNIKKQMVQGIDNSNCVVVFITRRYVTKVSGENASDNCQLEFNYAGLQKTGTNMIAVVMEPDMRNTRLWGEVGMVLGSNLYIDMSGDLDDEEYRMEKCEELKQSILQRNGKLVDEFYSDISKFLGSSSVDTAPVPIVTAPPQGDQGSLADTTTVSSLSTPTNARNIPAAVEGPVVPLDSLSVEDVGALLTALNMGQYREAVASQDIDGPCLSAAESPDELKEMGISITAKAKMLFNRLNDFKCTGVPYEYTYAAEEAKIAAEKAAAAAQAEVEKAEREAREAAEREERERKAAQAAEEKARKDAEAAANSLPPEINVGVHSHKMVSTDSSKSGWACNGKDFPGGCKSGCTGFRQMTGKPRWRCKSCDFDLCEKCAREHLITDPLPTTVFTSIHNHNLSLNSKNANGWACDGRQHGGCKSGSTGFRQLNGWNRYKCASGCDYDLCEKCVRAHLCSGSAPAPATSAPAAVPPHCYNSHEMYRKKTTSGWSCSLCVSKASSSNADWTKIRWKCDKCDTDLCDNCYSKVNGTNPPTCKNNHTMPFTLHKCGKSTGVYKGTWRCDDCRYKPSTSKGTRTGRFCCISCTSDLCTNCANKRR